VHSTSYTSSVELVENEVDALAAMLLAFNQRASAPRSRIGTAPSVRMGPQLHGSQQSRSPLVNWYTYEADIDLEMVNPRPSNHPFEQVPYLVDGDVEVFESGAILLYLADAYGGASTPQERAQYTKWVVWANSELDGLCFGAIPGDHRVRGTCMDKPDLRAVSTLEKLLSDQDWMVDNKFSVADVAICSYLNYVPIFFPQANLGATPSIAKYMKRCAERPAFAKAFGDGHANLVKQKVDEWLSSSSDAGSNPLDKLKDMMR
jgi:glutathione S-transferase/alpha,alpha-trehalase